MSKLFKNYINGKWKASASGETFENVNPANLNEVLSNAGCSFSDVVRATVYVTSMDNFPILNELYGNAMGPHRPARSTVEVSGLPKGALVEIDLVARLP